MRPDKLIAGTTVLCALLAVAARAEFPYPADPNRCDSSGNPPGCIPLANEMSGAPGACNGEKWKYASTNFCSTDATVNASPNELLGVTGMSVDIAWRIETGRPDVVIAVHDSGIEWNNVGAVNQLRKKFHLNAGELPAPAPAGGCNAPPGGDPRDCNGDGVFNMPDYDGDPRVTDMNGNGVTDPEDLIMIFSDGVDDDGNGYVDDICGWDFFEFDNDPFDEVQYGHGTGEAQDSTAEANNGGSLGTCPNCMVMPVRVGDSFVADVNSFAQGVVFSVDTGAAVVQEALGTYNNSAFAQQAVDYAYAHNVPVMASAADEDAWHHNFPSTYVHTIVVNSIEEFDLKVCTNNPQKGCNVDADCGTGGLCANPVQPASWLYFNGCTNFGANTAVSVSSTSCSSEATGRSSGMAGLLVSAGRNAVEHATLAAPLTANEIRQLFTQTADDVDFDTAGGPVGTPPQVGGRLITFPDTTRYATQAGFDQFTGYGRINIHRAVARVAAGQIPPEAEIAKPAWFQLFDPTRDGAFTVTGRVAADRAAGYTYRVQIAYGVQPLEADYVDVVPFGATLHAPVAGTLATITPADVPAPTADQIARRQNQLPDLTSDYDKFTYTIRVQVRDQPGNQPGEDRRAIFVNHDGDLKAPFPLAVGGDGASSPALADLDGDGRADIVFGTSDGRVYAKHADGSDLPGWPVAGDPIPYNPGSTAFASNAIPHPIPGAILASVAIGDIDGDGYLDVVAADMEGKVYAWDHHGARKAGFPVQVNLAYSAHDVKDEHNRVDRAIIASPALADLDGDGGLDIVVGGNDRHVYVWDGFGTPRPGFPLLVVDASRMASINPVNHHVVPLPGAFRGEKIVDSPAIGDIDHDGTLDIVVGTNESYDEPINASLTSGTSAALAQILAFAGQSPSNSRLYAIHKDGTFFGPGTSWPAKIAFFTAEILPNVGEGINASPALADVDGDGTLEIGVFSAAGPGYLLKADGTSFYGSDNSGNYRVMQTEGGSSTSPDLPSIPSIGEGAFGDLAGAGQLSFAAPAAGIGRLLAIAFPEQQLNADDHVSAWLATTGNFQPSFPHHEEDLQFLSGPSIADVGGAPTPEIIEGSAGYFLHAYDATGTEPLGWPKFTGGWHIANAAIGDVDGDGLNEVVTLTREGNLWVWDTTAPAGAQQWPKKRHDLRNTGNYDEPAGQTGNPTTTTTTTTVLGSTTTSTTSSTTTTLPGATGTLTVRRARLGLPEGAANDRITISAYLSLGAGSDGIDPTHDGFSLSLTGVRFDIPASAFTGTPGRWRYRDPAGLASDPDGITRVTVRIRRDGTFKLTVRGRNAELSTFDGTSGRTIQVRVDIGNDQAAANLAFRRTGRNLRYP